MRRIDNYHSLESSPSQPYRFGLRSGFSGLGSDPHLLFFQGKGTKPGLYPRPTASRFTQQRTAGFLGRWRHSSPAASKQPETRGPIRPGTRFRERKFAPPGAQHLHTAPTAHSVLIIHHRKSKPRECSIRRDQLHYCGRKLSPEIGIYIYIYIYWNIRTVFHLVQSGAIQSRIFSRGLARHLVPSQF